MIRRRFVTMAMVLAVLPGFAGVAHPADAAPSAPVPCRNGYVSLSFDDSPTVLTPALLAALRSAKLSGTFFDVGTRAEKFGSYVSAQRAAGHWVGNHSYSHPDLVPLGEPATLGQLSDDQAVLTPLAGVVPTLFRPPYGSTSSQVRLDAAGLGMTEVIWTVDTNDWVAGATASAISKSALAVKAGGFVLMHDGYQATIKAIPQIATGLASRGLCPGKIIYSAAPTASWAGGPSFNATVAAPTSTAPTSPPLPSSGPSPMSTLADAFDGPALDTAVWDGSSNGVVSLSAGHATVPCTSVYPTLGTTTTYDLTSSGAFARFTPPAVGNGSREAFFQLLAPSGDGLQWARSGSAFWPRYSSGGAWTEGPAVTYDAALRAWWRIHHSGGNIAWDTSSDGRTWTNVWTVPAPFAVTAMTPDMVCGRWSDEGAAALDVDDFNVAPPTP